MTPRNLILSEQSVAGLRIPDRPVRRPGIATVYTTADGRVECPGRVLTPIEARLGHYRTVYEVDTTHHQCSFTTTRDPLPARDDRHFFWAGGTVIWHVAKPAIVVEKDVRDGERVVLRRVLDLMRLISRTFDSTDHESVEREINRLTANGGIEHRDSGLSIDDISAHVTLDRTPVVRHGTLLAVSGRQPARTWRAAGPPSPDGPDVIAWRPRRHRTADAETTE